MAFVKNEIGYSFGASGHRVICGYKSIRHSLLSFSADDSKHVRHSQLSFSADGSELSPHGMFGKVKSVDHFGANLPREFHE